MFGAGKASEVRQAGVDGAGADSPGAGAHGEACLRALRCRARDAVHAMADSPVLRNDTVAEVAAMRRQARELATINWAHLNDREALASTAELEVLRRQVAAALATAMAHVDNTTAATVASGLSTPSWLAHDTNGSPHSARRHLHMGATMARFPGFAAAVAAGELSDEHLLALHHAHNPRITHQLCDIEATLLDLAHNSNFTEFRRALTAIVALLDTDGPEPDCTDTDTLNATRAADGTLHLRAMFSGHQGATIETALEHETRRQHRLAVADRDNANIAMPTNAVLRARALTQLIRNSLATNPATTVAARTDATIIISTDNPTIAATTTDGEPLHPNTATHLTCDANLHPIIVDTHSQPLWAGRSTRLVTPTLRRALTIRDGGCTFPGCTTAPSHCDAHHIIHWTNGGPTDITNLTLTCRRHHGLIHANWNLTTHTEPPPPHAPPNTPPTTTFLYITPTGQQLPAQHHGLAHQHRAGP